ncbi:DUF2306 domain-containing protein [Cognatishimia activa]|uniref:DUF2306 domain-containing protein n=1 Tax=Cognatishimia activa TaxID=1715691 RepID=UPI0022322F87|nr:DUF2306 domain-containing protein [Cognatishimia activa]UZD91712.1 DUF2306 domain-containing protein [Cognatishimia activa]
MTTLSVLTNMQPNVALHAGAATFAFCLTPFVLWRQKRDRLHKILGYAWVIAMAITALSSFSISAVGGFGRFSFLHGLAILALWSLYSAIRMAIKGNIKGHQAALRNLATFGLGLPMVLNFLPDRTLSRAFSNESPLLGLTLMSLMYIGILVWRTSKRKDQKLRSILPLTRFSA